MALHESRDPKRLVEHWRLIGAAARDPSLSKADAAVLWSILQMINRLSGTTFPSLETIANAAGISQRSAPRSINRLCERGYLIKTKRKGKGKGIVRSNLYQAGSIPDEFVTDKSLTDKSLTDKSLTDKTVTDKTAPQSMTDSSLTGMTTLSDISASKSYQLLVPASTADADASRPADPIWGTGLAFLVRKGISMSSARGLLGQLRKAAGDVETGAILADAETKDISDPAPWLMAAAARARNRGVARPSAAADFRGKTYDATPIDQLPEYLRSAFAGGGDG